MKRYYCNILVSLYLPQNENCCKHEKPAIVVSVRKLHSLISPLITVTNLHNNLNFESNIHHYCGLQSKIYKLFKHTVGL